MLLTAEQIKSAQDTPTEKVLTPEWAPPGATPEQRAQCHVLIRVMDGRARQRWDEARSEALKNDKTWIPDSEALLAVLCCCKEDLSPAFTEMDVQWLTKKSHIPLGRIWQQAGEFNHLWAEAAEQAEKNSEEAPSGEPGSSSHANGDGRKTNAAAESTAASSRS